MVEYFPWKCHRIHGELNRLILDIFSISKIENNLSNNITCNSRKKNPMQPNTLTNFREHIFYHPKQSPPPTQKEAGLTHCEQYSLYLDPHQKNCYIPLREKKMLQISTQNWPNNFYSLLLLRDIFWEKEAFLATWLAESLPNFEAYTRVMECPNQQQLKHYYFCKERSLYKIPFSQAINWERIKPCNFKNGCICRF